MNTDLFILISHGLLEEPIYLISFMIMMVSISLAFWWPGILTIISALTLVILHAWADSAGSGALAIIPIIEMAKLAVGFSLTIFLARIGFERKSKS
mgnify:CR=1 FL=1|jgi:hypothetical protein